MNIDENATGKNLRNEASNNIIRPFSEQLLTWFASEKRDLPWRHTSDPYHIWVSEVMLQQTQVKTVIPYYQRFLQRFSTLEDLARADFDSILAAWRGLGYYSRARHLWEGARHVFSVWNGRVPSDYETLLQIPGIGEYTAGAIASIAFRQKVPALDGNVRRVVARLLAWPEPTAKASSLHRFREQLRIWQPVDHPGDFNQALMELGATLCIPNTPHCPDCPVSASCQAFSSGNFNYPVRVPKKKPETMLRLTFVLLHKGAMYLQKRPANGLLASLWEFPGLELPFSTPAFAPAEWLAFYREAIAERTFDPEAERFFQEDFPLYGPARHTFSHLRWELYWVIISLESAPREFSAPLLQARANLPLRESSTPLLYETSSRPLQEPSTLSLREPSSLSLPDASPAWPMPSTPKNPGGSWVIPEALSDYPLPSAFTAILKHLQAISSVK